MQLHVTLIYVLLYSEYDSIDQLHKILLQTFTRLSRKIAGYGRDTKIVTDGTLKKVEYFNHKVFI